MPPGISHVSNSGDTSLRWCSCLIKLDLPEQLLQGCSLLAYFSKVLPSCTFHLGTSLLDNFFCQYQSLKEGSCCRALEKITWRRPWLYTGTLVVRNFPSGPSTSYVPVTFSVIRSSLFTFDLNKTMHKSLPLLSSEMAFRFDEMSLG